MTSENLSPPTVLPCSVQPRVETSWLALPLSARGLVDELSKYTDENARIIVSLDEGADFRAVGKEIARLLCAHPGELARVRSDTKRLMADGFLAVDGSALRLSRIAHETARSVERSDAMTDAERSRRYRENQKLLRDAEVESSRNVTRVTEDRDDFRDDRHVTSVTRPLSFKEDLNVKSLKEREAVTPIVTANVTRCRKRSTKRAARKPSSSVLKTTASISSGQGSSRSTLVKREPKWSGMIDGSGGSPIS